MASVGSQLAGTTGRQVSIAIAKVLEHPPMLELNLMHSHRGHVRDTTSPSYARLHVRSCTLVRSWLRSDTRCDRVRGEPSQDDERAAHSWRCRAGIGISRRGYDRSRRCSASAVGTAWGPESSRGQPLGAQSISAKGGL